jgi:hypothetical protein
MSFHVFSLPLWCDNVRNLLQKRGEWAVFCNKFVGVGDEVWEAVVEVLMPEGGCVR